MNECHFMGNLTREPELKYIATGTPVVNFGIAINRTYKKNSGERAKETAFIECEAWDTGAELINKHFKKGDLIIVHCSVKTESWETEGQKRSRNKFRVNKFEFVPGRKREEESAPVTVSVDAESEDGHGKPPF